MLGCIQPMSSPIMKRMLGFCCCCANAGVIAAATMAAPARIPRHNFRTLSLLIAVHFISCSIQVYTEAPPRCSVDSRLDFFRLARMPELSTAERGPLEYYLEIANSLSWT